MIPASLAFWLAMLVSGGATDFLPYLGPFWGFLANLALWLFGFQLLIGRYIYDAWKRSRTFYGITDRRVMILKGKGASNLRSWILADLGELRLVNAPMGRKSVALFWSEWNSRGVTTRLPATLPVEFYDDSLELIDDAETVLSLLQSLKATARQKRNN